MWGRVAFVLVLVHFFSVFGEENLLKEKSFISIDRSDHAKSLFGDCKRSYSTTCLKKDLITLIDKLEQAENFTLLSGVSLVKENTTKTPEVVENEMDLVRNFPGGLDSKLDVLLLRKVRDFLGNHVVKIDLMGEDSETARKGGGGGGGKKGGGMGYIIAAAAMMKGTMMALALGGLAAMAGKAMMAAMISLMLSAIIGLKSLSSGGQKTTYEVIAKPHYSQAQTYSSSHEDYSVGGHGGGHSSGYGRSFDLPLPLSLQPGYAPGQ